MAALQIIDPTEAGHNYADKSVIGHTGRSAGVDIYGEGNATADIDKVYTNSIFDEISAASTTGGNATTTPTPSTP